MNDNLTRDLARALGLPPGTTRAVLTLLPGRPPMMEVECYINDADGEFIVQSGDRGMAQRLASVQFMLRLEPYPDFGVPA